MTQPNLIRDVRLDISDELVRVEIDGIRGEVTGGQARQVREILADAALTAIQETTRQRAAEDRMYFAIEKVDNATDMLAGEEWASSGQGLERTRP